jgi:hypothetical protein
MTSRIVQPFTRIGGRMSVPPPILAHLQTDGSFHPRSGARVAMILHTLDQQEIHQQVQNVLAETSMEAEWMSVEQGLQFALNKNETRLAIENDNLGVVTALISPNDPVKQEIGRYYRERIYGIAKYGNWIGIRWIPRGQNDADALFRQQRPNRNDPSSQNLVMC